MALKVSYAEENGLGGIMYWEYRCDGTGTLTSFLRRELDRGLCPGGKQEPGRRPCPGVEQEPGGGLCPGVVQEPEVNRGGEAAHESD